RNEHRRLAPRRGRRRSARRKEKEFGWAAPHDPLGSSPHPPCLRESTCEPTGQPLSAQEGSWALPAQCCKYLCLRRNPTGELEFVVRAQYVEKEGIAAPTGKEPVVTTLCHMSCLTCRDRHSLNDNLPPAPVSAAPAPSTRRSVARCSPPSNDEKRTS